MDYLSKYGYTPDQEAIGRALEHPELLLTHVQLRRLLDFIRQKLLNKYRDECDIDEEELSVDEYNLSIAESIVRDELLYDFLDTTLRIGIGDYIYKITEDGTFAFKSSIYSTNYCDSILRDFDSSKYNYLNVGEYVELSNEVLYIKSFDKYACSEEVLMPEESFVGNKSVSNERGPECI